MHKRLKRETNQLHTLFVFAHALALRLSAWLTAGAPELNLSLL
jgi:hypothetical protein